MTDNTNNMFDVLPGRFSCLPHQALALSLAEQRLLHVVGAMTWGGEHPVAADEIRAMMAELFELKDRTVNETLRSLYDAGWLEISATREVGLTEKYDVQPIGGKTAAKRKNRSPSAEKPPAPHAGVHCLPNKDQIKVPVSDDTNTNPQATRERNKANTVSADKTRQLLMGYEEAEKKALPKDEAKARIQAMRDQLKRQP